MIHELKILENNAHHFDARYLAACNLHNLVRAIPEHAGAQTIAALTTALQDPTILCQRQSLFLCRELTNTLTVIFMEHENKELADNAFTVLQETVRNISGTGHRAASEALGSLPVTITWPEINTSNFPGTPKVSWDEFSSTLQIKLNAHADFAGRSLVIPGQGNGMVPVIKLGRSDDTPEKLSQEVIWMEHLGALDSYPVRFNVPKVIKIKGSNVFRLKDLPFPVPEALDLHPEYIAVAYFADREYFNYPNDHDNGAALSGTQFKEIMQQNSLLLGWLAGHGIIHTAPIPLFHNRVQRGRRTDEGVYDWPLAGRLDRWLSSCKHPNFGPTGARDFEHFAALQGNSEKIYHAIGIHLLSLFLVSASYFRNKEPARTGLTDNGHPVDARDLFDAQLLDDLIRTIFKNYYTGFVGQPYRDALPFDCERLVLRMIEEMGVDRYMDEMLRTVDQEEMDEETFIEILTSWGYTEREAAAFRKGEKDIPLLTGPHLGGFNQPISLPELIEATASMSAFCIAGKHLSERNSVSI